ncbi:MAG: hypothetical protein CMH64_03125 [Nanoarchaeota archaeon]|nr:hypothetical protein [Nanoarchaeota archaeon]|tara:strand:- start:342 stop:944 length:603 start_codon:yes stop_codon:yes gene_type:complete
MPKKKVVKKKSSKKLSLKKLDKKLNKILKYEKEQKKNDSSIKKLGKKALKQDEDVEEDLEKLREDLQGSPLKKITTKDFGKALIGSFIGVTSHFAFLEGAHFAEQLTLIRATSLLVVAYIVGLVFIYAAGFRKVKQIKVLSFVPLRITLIYIVALSVIFFVLYIYGITGHSPWALIYKQVAAVSIPAIIGASAADLIGEH